jgi:hypothetical protein
MNIHEHPNVKEYLAHFLLTLRKHTVLTDETCFEVQARDGELRPEEIDELR